LMCMYSNNIYLLEKFEIYIHEIHITSI